VAGQKADGIAGHEHDVPTGVGAKFRVGSVARQFTGASAATSTAPTPTSRRFPSTPEVTFWNTYPGGATASPRAGWRRS
jgi:hypothetical protein